MNLTRTEITAQAQAFCHVNGLVPPVIEFKEDDNQSGPSATIFLGGRHSGIVIDYFEGDEPDATPQELHTWLEAGRDALNVQWADGRTVYHALHRVNDDDTKSSICGDLKRYFSPKQLGVIARIFKFNTTEVT